MLVSLVKSGTEVRAFHPALKYEMHSSWNRDLPTCCSGSPWAAGITLGGNLGLLGAASNLIIVGAAESQGRKALLGFLALSTVVTEGTSFIFFSYLACV